MQYLTLKTRSSIVSAYFYEYSEKCFEFT